MVGEIFHTIKGAVIKVTSETTVAVNQANEQTDRYTRGRGNLLTTSEMGTTRGTRQMAPGICFHPVYVNSHTQNVSVVTIANCRKKNAATPGDRGSAHYGRDV